MATLQPASPEAGPSAGVPTGTEIEAVPPTEAGIELEAALPVGVRLEDDEISPVSGRSDPEAVAGIGLDGPAGELLPHPVGGSVPSDVGESSAAHLVGTSEAEIHSVDTKFATLLTTVHENRPGDDLEIIRKAWAFCLQQHEGQKRASGEPYVIHPLEVGQVLAELRMDSTAIAAGLLHDAVEDTDVTSAEIAKQFGEQVAHIVEGVTKLDKIKFANREDHQAENIRKMLLAMVIT